MKVLSATSLTVTIASLAAVLVAGKDSDAASKHCPKNCVKELKQVCDQVEGILEAIPLLPAPLLDLVGTSICFPENADSSKDSLCPKKCKDDQLKKVCNYVDSILLDAKVPKFVRNVTDVAICTIGEMIPNQNDLVLEVGGKQKDQDTHNKHCPKDCDGKLVELCDDVVGIIDAIPLVPEYVSEIVGHSICFPKDSKPHDGNLCPKKCGGAERICQYVDQILIAVPQSPKFARNITDHMICAVAEHLPDQHNINRLRANAVLF